jgi:hypothetical protein
VLVVASSPRTKPHKIKKLPSLSTTSLSTCRTAGKDSSEPRTCPTRPTTGYRSYPKRFVLVQIRKLDGSRDAHVSDRAKRLICPRGKCIGLVLSLNTRQGSLKRAQAEKPTCRRATGVRSRKPACYDDPTLYTLPARHAPLILISLMVHGLMPRCVNLSIPYIGYEFLSRLDYAAVVREVWLMHLPVLTVQSPGSVWPCEPNREIPCSHSYHQCWSLHDAWLVLRLLTEASSGAL